MTFTEPKIVTSNDLSTRSYITFYFKGSRVREYNGKSLNLNLNPNRATSLMERYNILKKLCFEFHKALDSSLYQSSVIDPINYSTLSKKKAVINEEMKTSISTKCAMLALDEALEKKLNSKLSKKYKRNLMVIHGQFKSYFTDDELFGVLKNITIQRIEGFLSQFGSTGTYYMNKRRDLGVLFNVAGKLLDETITSVQSTEKRKSKAKLHKPYDKEQLQPLLLYLKENNPNLYICCLLTFATWLRPHEEIRLLKSSNFTHDNTEIHLSGDSNKGGQVRAVHVPEYIRKEIMPLLQPLEKDKNIFSGRILPFNDDYFNTQWGRVRTKLLELRLIHQHQTIYSFRHTAAIDTYKRTKDVYLLQKLLGHSTILVTLKYLRNLGELNSDELKDAAPKLEFEL